MAEGDGVDVWADSSEDEEMEVLVAVLETEKPSSESQKDELSTSHTAAGPRYSVQRKMVKRDFQRATEAIFQDWLGPAPTFSAKRFQETFRLSRSVYDMVFAAVSADDDFFQQRVNAAGRLGVSGHAKVLVALQMLGHGGAPAAYSHYYQMSDTLARDSMKRFARSVINVFKDEFLRPMTNADAERVAAAHQEKFGIGGYLGGIDCTHLKWDRCPNAWHGHYSGKEGFPTIVVEALFSDDLRCWHMEYGSPGSQNDITVFRGSPLMEAMISDTMPVLPPYTLNGRVRTSGYISADGIYPNLAWFWKGGSEGGCPRESYMIKRQEAIRKAAERGFGVLKIRWKILYHGINYFLVGEIGEIVECCFILHNMMIEASRESNDVDYLPPAEGEAECVSGDVGGDSYAERYNFLTDGHAHGLLRHDIMEELWAKREAHLAKT
eukprot:scaffold7331_cov316-Pinguiococcus_pyrenoidosus.AAC.1